MKVGQYPLATIGALLLLALSIFASGETTRADTVCDAPLTTRLARIFNIGPSSAVNKPSRRIFDLLRFQTDNRTFKEKPASYQKQVNGLARELDRLSPQTTEEVLSRIQEFLKSPSHIRVIDNSDPYDSKFIGENTVYGINVIRHWPPHGDVMIQKFLDLPSHLSIQEKLTQLEERDIQDVRTALKKNFDFDRLRKAETLITGEGRLTLSDPWVHSKADLAEKLLKNYDLKKYEPEEAALLEKFANALTLTRQDAYAGRNQMLYQMKLQEAHGTAVGIASTLNSIAQVIATRRYLAGDNAIGLWLPAISVGKFTPETSLFPIESLYGKGGERKIFWVLNDHERSVTHNPKINVRVGWGQPDLDEMRVVVNHARNEKGELVPVSLETMVPSADKSKGPVPFFFKNINGEWIPQHTFTMPNGKELPVDRACLVCHGKGTPGQEILSPVPLKLVGDQGKRLREAGGYNPEVVDHVLEYMVKPY